MKTILRTIRREQLFDAGLLRPLVHRKHVDLHATLASRKWWISVYGKFMRRTYFVSRAFSRNWENYERED